MPARAYPGAVVIGIKENVGVNEGLNVRAIRRERLAVPTQGRSRDSIDVRPAALLLRNPDLVRPAFLTVQAILGHPQIAAADSCVKFPEIE